METNIGLVSPLFAEGIHYRWSLRSNSPAMKSFSLLLICFPIVLGMGPMYVLCLWSKPSTTEQLSILELLKWGYHLPGRSTLPLPSLAMPSLFSKNPLRWDTILKVWDNSSHTPLGIVPVCFLIPDESGGALCHILPHNSPSNLSETAAKTSHQIFFSIR